MSVSFKLDWTVVSSHETSRVVRQTIHCYSDRCMTGWGYFMSLIWLLLSILFGIGSEGWGWGFGGARVNKDWLLIKR